MSLPVGKLFGRKRGKPLNPYRRDLWQTLLPACQISIPAAGLLQPADLFPFVPRALSLEIGFGAGEHLAALAAAAPDCGFLGCEVFAQGTAGLLALIDRQQLRNIRIFPADARLLLTALPEASLTAVYILYADPWPKTRHRERRFVQPAQLAHLARVLADDGLLRLASDDPDLQDWLRRQLAVAPDFRPLPGWSLVPPEGWRPTRYELKALRAGRQPLYGDFRRIPRTEHAGQGRGQPL